jgi:hypothetical protein
MQFQVTDKLQTLNDEFAAMTKKKKELEDAIDICCQKLDRAGKLIGEYKCLLVINTQVTEVTTLYRYVDNKQCKIQITKPVTILKKKTNISLPCRMLHCAASWAN